MSKKIKVLNLFAGIGGNRKLWENVDVTAVELNPDIAAIYMDFFPDDEMIVGDAHQFLLENFDKGYDFIWASPPCPTHSRIRKLTGVTSGQVEPVYPDMMLYQEILFLKHYFDGKWCVENVIAYYDPLIKPYEIASHWFWANFNISDIYTDKRGHHSSMENLQKRKGFDLSAYSNIDKRIILRNCVEPETGKHIFDCAFRVEQKSLLGV